MKARILFLFLLTAMAWSLCGADQTRFIAMDVTIDPKGQPLAAYQLEIKGAPGVKIVGVEGGEHPEFRKAPYYDPKGIQSERLIVAAFTTVGADKLPTATTRILTLHLECSTSGTPKMEMILKLAAKPDGQRFTAQATLTERNAP
jgi:hypothetical protein